MNFDFAQPLATDAATAFMVLHDRFTDLPAYLPNVLSIREVERRAPDSDGSVRTVHRWQADPELIPKIARTFLKPSLLEWVGDAHWQPASGQVNFVFSSDHFAGLYSCDGTFRIVTRGAGCDIRIDVRFDVYPERLPGVPKWMARRAAPVVEQTLVSAVRPSLAALPQALTHLLPRSQ